MHLVMRVLFMVLVSKLAKSSLKNILKVWLKYTVIRYGSLYGERASHNNYIYNLLFKAIKSGVLEYKKG